MALPPFSKITLPLLKLLRDGNEHSVDELEESLASIFQISDEERNQIKPSGGEKLFLHKIRWARTHLKYAELVKDPRRSYVQITQRGLDLLSENPPDLTENYLTRFPEYAERRRHGGGDLWPLSKLTDFVKNTMKMDYNYQPIVIMSLLKCPNFTASTKLIADQLARYNSYRKDYSQALKEAVEDTMGPNGRGFVKIVNSDTIKLLLEEIPESEKRDLIELCYEKIAKWDSENIVTEDGRKEKIADNARFFLLLPNEKGSISLLENSYTFDNWSQPGNQKPKVYGEVKIGDIILVYFAAKSVTHPMLLKTVYKVVDVSKNHERLDLKPVKSLFGLPYQKIKELRDSGVLGEKFNSVGYPLNFTEIFQQDYRDALFVDYKLKPTVEHSIFQKSYSITNQVMNEHESGPFSGLTSFLKDERVEGYKGNILTKVKHILKSDEENIIEKLKEACSQRTVGNHIFRFVGGPEESEARVLYAITEESEEVQQEFKEKLRSFFESVDELEFGNRWDSLVSLMRSIKSSSTRPDFLFLCYLAFLQNPKLHFPFTPTRADTLFEFFGIPQITSGLNGDKTWRSYEMLLELANELRLKLADNPELDLIDVQGYMWVLGSALQKGIKDDGGVESVSNSMEPTEDEDICNEYEEKGYFELLNTEKQIIFYGPPGTGKTFTAKNVAKCFTRFKEDGSPDEFIGRLIDELKMISKVSGYAFEKEGSASQKMFVMKKGDDEIRVEFHKAVKGDYFMVNAGTRFLTENPNAKNFLIITNESVGSFLCLPYDVEQEYSEFVTEGDGTGGWDSTGKGKHSVHNLKINREEAHFEPKKGNTQQKDVSEYLNTWKHLSEDSHFKSTNIARTVYHVTFHPSYSYEDFIEGFRPNVGKDSSAPYFLDRGIFMRACDYARMDENRRIVVIIDEINRGNIPKILGELITLIEKDKRNEEFSLKLTYSKDDFFVPKNLYIIATMNTADKSLMQMDDALKRRFVFEELMPDIGVLVKHLQEKGVDGAEQYANILDRMNKKILGDGLDDKKREQRMKQFRDRQIGHSYFWDIQNDENLQTVIKHDIIPLLQDYFYGDFNEVRRILGEKNDGKDTSIIGDDNRSTKLVTDKLKAKDLRDKLLKI